MASVEQQLEQIISQVGDIQDLPEYLRLKRQQKTPGTRSYRMRTMEPPSAIQTGVRYLFGFGMLGAISYFTATQGIEAYGHYMAINHALGDMQTTLHNINVLNVPQSGQHILTDIGQVRDNMLSGIVSGAKSVIGANADIGFAALYRPWKKPQRKGRFWGIA